MILQQEPCLMQGSKEWLKLRKSRITATDAAICMGLNPWKDTLQLYNEKLDIIPQEDCNAAMQRGIDMEPIAREAFEKETGYLVFPQVIVQDWQMASLDGMDLHGFVQVEIKCGGKKLHDMAKKKVIPAYYRCQIQHQMLMTGLEYSYYYSFNGNEGIVLVIERNDDFIEEMVVAEKQFYECLISRIPPIKKATF